MKYHKIQTLFKRDEKNIIIPNQFTLPEFLLLRGIEWVWTEKVDGTNIRITLDESLDSQNTFEFGGRTDNAQMPTRLLKILMEKFDSSMVDKVRSKVQSKITFFGEGYGAKIQKGGGNYIPGGNDFVLFDANIDGWTLKRDSLEELGKSLEIAVVPIVGKGTLDEAIEFVKGKPLSKWGDFAAEGIVCRPAVELFQRNGKRIITKIKCKDFLDLARD